MRKPRLSHYAAALALAQQVDAHLTNSGIGHAVRGHVAPHHYWTKSGELLTDLNQVVNAILDNNLLTREDLNNNEKRTEE